VTRVIVDTDTAGDDTQALLLACLTDRLAVAAVTVVAGNVPFDREVENAKYTLSLADADDVPVYEGAAGGPPAPRNRAPRGGGGPPPRRAPGGAGPRPASSRCCASAR
jgi:inosine-uridine nucleoside N-ribohydrolase